MPCHHAQHTQNMGPNLFTCNENSAYVMPCVTACVVMSCVHCVAHVYVVRLKLLMDMPYAPADHHAQHTQNMGPNLFTCNENSAYVMPCVTACVVMSCVHCVAHVYVVRQKLLMDMPFAPAELYLSKLTAPHFGTLNTRIANQNELKRILIAMHNKNKTDCNENFRICVEEPIAPLYKQ